MKNAAKMPRKGLAMNLFMVYQLKDIQNTNLYQTQKSVTKVKACCRSFPMQISDPSTQLWSNFSTKNHNFMLSNKTHSYHNPNKQKLQRKLCKTFIQNGSKTFLFTIMLSAILMQPRYTKMKLGLDMHVVYQMNNKSQISVQIKVPATTKTMLQHPNRPRQI